MKFLTMLLCSFIIMLSLTGCYIQSGDNLIFATYYDTPNEAYLANEYYNSEMGDFDAEICNVEVDDVALYVYMTNCDYIVISPLRIKNHQYASLGRYEAWKMDASDSSLSQFSHSEISLSNGKTLCFGLVWEHEKEQCTFDNVEFVDFNVKQKEKTFDFTLYYFYEQ